MQQALRSNRCRGAGAFGTGATAPRRALIVRAAAAVAQKSVSGRMAELKKAKKCARAGCDDTGRLRRTIAPPRRRQAAAAARDGRFRMGAAAERLLRAARVRRTPRRTP